ncbi:MAG: methionyl-tRNA formyltransferase [Gammaproteobacteria bacterium]
MRTTARIIFAGTPEFTLPPLQTLIDSPHEVVAVLTQPDRPAGRGRKLTPSPVKQLALGAGIDVLQPLSLKAPEVQQQLADLQPDLMVVVAYGLLLPQAVLDIPVRGCVNIHASLLPRWRGASPIQMSVLHGDTESGVCIMQMDAGLDTGPELARSVTSIGDHETAGELHDRLAPLGGEFLAEQLGNILAGSITPAPQPDEGVTYAGRINKADGLIDWTQSAVAIDRQIRAYHPWPVAHTLYQGKNLRCLQARPASVSGDQLPGTVLSLSADGLHVQTGEGVLQIEKLQLAGKKPVSAVDFSNAHETDSIVLGR